MTKMSTKLKEFQSVRQSLRYSSAVGKVRVGFRRLSLQGSSQQLYIARVSSVPRGAMCEQGNTT